MENFSNDVKAMQSLFNIWSECGEWQAEQWKKKKRENNNIARKKKLIRISVMGNLTNEKFSFAPYRIFGIKPESYDIVNWLGGISVSAASNATSHQTDGNDDVILPSYQMIWKMFCVIKNEDFFSFWRGKNICVFEMPLVCCSYLAFQDMSHQKLFVDFFLFPFSLICDSLFDVEM